MFRENLSEPLTESVVNPVDGATVSSNGADDFSNNASVKVFNVLVDSFLDDDIIFLVTLVLSAVVLFHFVVHGVLVLFIV